MPLPLLYRNTRLTACSRLADLDGKIQGILDNLAEKDGQSTTVSVPDGVLAQTTLRDISTPESTSSSTGPASSDDSIRRKQQAAELQTTDWANRLFPDHAALEQLLNRFRAMQHHFPFVVIADNWDISMMLRSHNCLLLAAVANAASHKPHLQDNLAKEFRSLIAQRVVVDGESSLDLLQGLLVNLAWSQFFLIPRSQQAYKYLQMAVSMLVDLGLDVESEDTRKERPDVFLRRNDFKNDLNGMICMTAEARGARLGCLYLSSVICSSMNKPGTLKINHGVLAWATTIVTKTGLDSDQAMLSLMQYQKILDDLESGYRDAKRSAILDMLFSHAMEMKKALDGWFGSLPDTLRTSGLFTSRYHAANVRIFEMSLLFHFNKTPQFPRPTRHPETLETNLVHCVDSIKSYLDTFLAMNSNEYSSLPFEEWMRLLISFFILYKLSAGSRDIPDWDVQNCRKIIDMEEYLTTVARLFRGIRSPMDIESSTREEVYFVLPEILESARNSYILKRDVPELIGPGHRVHIDLSRSRRTDEASASASKSKCPATGFWIDKALAVDRSSDWHDVAISQALHPSQQLAKNDDLWNGLLYGNEADD